MARCVLRMGLRFEAFYMLMSPDDEPLDKLVNNISQQFPRTGQSENGDATPGAGRTRPGSHRVPLRSELS